MTINMTELGKGLEPSARDHAPRELEAIYSIAISLKRLADLAEKQAAEIEGDAAND